jgi:hypothetical protein
MQKDISTPPRTAFDVFQMLPVGTLAEVIENQLFMAPSPSPDHQEASGNLFYESARTLGRRSLVRFSLHPLTFIWMNTPMSFSQTSFLLPRTIH